MQFRFEMEKTKLNKAFDKRFGKFIKKKREERDWSQSVMASHMGNNSQNISRLERGEITPTLYWCKKLADVLEIELSDLIKEFSSY